MTLLFLTLLFGFHTHAQEVKSLFESTSFASIKIEKKVKTPQNILIRSRGKKSLFSLIAKSYAPIDLVDGGTPAVKLSLERVSKEYRALGELSIPKNEFLQSSFIIDFTEPEVVSVSKTLVNIAGKKPKITAIETFVHNFIEKKEATITSDFASVVAKSKRGDCTEHALLLAALGRAAGYPTRMVYGIAIIKNTKKGSFQAFGHAWNEILVEKSWRHVDGTKIHKQKGYEVIYLPFKENFSEGVDYKQSLLNSGLINVDKIELR